ncbi:TIGR00341 family protein [Salinibacillus xinjiangensis]|uniref:TIGR00341 family protein n=1 Tax=Salinibacillus xinjiangensis TaxID=1229268 RepID=A0A6G1X7C6_9BACI|nr:TIGR00341 family protein [Salinibacillus xinjiangensis]MRG86847.1 TIGR00341 family protein [Salinibacillus xinjiangensis]
MKMQLIEIFIPMKHFEKTKTKLQEFPHLSFSTFKEREDLYLVRMVVESKDVEDILNYLESVSAVAEGFETILIPVQTYMSRETLQEKNESKEEKEEEEQSTLMRASRQELIQTIDKNSHITTNYTLLIILSAIVATVGFLKNSEAVVIGAMVIAPMIGPIISIAFSAILGDYKKVGQSTLTFLFGFVIVVAISILFSYFFRMGTENDQFIARTEVTISDFFLALASGAAGALATLNRLSGNLVGVMVAVALLPPTIAVGLSIGQALWIDAYGSALLITVNTTCILLSAITIFSISGIRPVRWREVQKANVSRTFSFIFVGTIVGILVLVILIGQGVKFE